MWYKICSVKSNSSYIELQKIYDFENVKFFHSVTELQQLFHYLKFSVELTILRNIHEWCPKLTRTLYSS